MFQGQPQDLDAEPVGVSVGLLQGEESVADGLACRGQSGGLVEKEYLASPKLASGAQPPDEAERVPADVRGRSGEADSPQMHGGSVDRIRVAGGMDGDGVHPIGREIA